MSQEEESELVIIQKKIDDRSDFEKTFEDDSLQQLQNRMIAKAKTKKYTPEDFIEKAKKDLEEEFEITTSKPDFEETEEPETEDDDLFFF